MDLNEKYEQTRDRLIAANAHVEKLKRENLELQGRMTGVLFTLKVTREHLGVANEISVVEGARRAKARIEELEASLAELRAAHDAWMNTKNREIAKAAGLLRDMKADKARIEELEGAVNKGAEVCPSCGEIAKGPYHA